MKSKSIAVALVAVTAIPTVQAAGFYLKEQSIVSQGVAFAGTTARTDAASSVYFNPAGIAGMQSMIEAGAHLLIPDQTVTGTQAIGLMSTAAQEPLSNSTIPNFYYVRPLESGVIGFGISAPFGSKNEYSDTFIGSLDAAKTKLKTVDYSFAYGMSLSEQVRAGLAVVYQTADIEQRKVVSSQLLGQATNSTATLKGDSTALGLTIGMQFDLEDGGTLGVAYKKGTTQEIAGTNTISANFNLPVSGVGAIPIAAGSYAASGDLNLPSMLSISLIKPVSESTSLMFDVTRYGWSSYGKLDVATTWGAPLGTQTTSSPQNYSDTTSFSFGAEHDYGNGLITRAGVHFDPTPTNDTDRSFSTPDGDRTWLAFGLSKTIESGATLDFAYTRIDVDKSDINRRINSAITARATAESTFNIVSVGIRLPLD
jgi:long-chain fatty acid transport protein